MLVDKAVAGCLTQLFGGEMRAVRAFGNAVENRTQKEVIGIAVDRQLFDCVALTAHKSVKTDGNFAAALVEMHTSDAVLCRQPEMVV